MLGFISLLLILVVAITLVQWYPAVRKPAAETVRGNNSPTSAFLGPACNDGPESHSSISLVIADAAQIDFASGSPEAHPLDELFEDLKSIIQEAAATKANKPNVLDSLRDVIDETEALSFSDREHLQLSILEAAQDHLHFDLTLPEVQSLWPETELSKSNPYETNLTN